MGFGVRVSRFWVSCSVFCGLMFGVSGFGFGCDVFEVPGFGYGVSRFKIFGFRVSWYYVSILGFGFFEDRGIVA